MSRQPFDPLTFPLEGLRLIEASAGTGKTFSLAGLYLRLLVEKQLDVRDILVMTFTRAATQELRERIRARITAAAVIAADPGRAVDGDVEHDIATRLIAVAEAHEPREQIARRLRNAAARMDDATIATIHGFAQQAAQENAFNSGLPFDRGTQINDPTMHLEAVTDY
jgi:exodeoxyribonuclease V beta subunit